MSSTPQNPTVFRRGTTFAYAVNIPDTFHDGYFRLWDVNSQVRKLNNETRNGLVSTLAHYWENAITTRRLIVFDGDTEAWPLGLVESDVLLISSTGYRIRTKPLFMKIERGVTR
jgi:hypothetical protein